ncbi:MAG: hypothetical protein P4L35_17810 [Ignavibacteriaceae bacterium]|nr:hypothetical protein [Ignavibacteriaceae bacterium]
MIKKIKEYIVTGIGNLIKNTTQEVRRINSRYSVPHAKMTKGVKFSLMILRIYLLVLIGILCYKFITLL